MTCRHTKGDPACTSTAGGWAWREEQERYRKSAVKSAQEESKKAFQIQTIEEVGNLLVLQILYPSCADCTYEGLKTLVVQATLKQAVFWCKADPHFRAGPFSSNEMPSPLARFPSTPTGLADAMAFAKSKNI